MSIISYAQNFEDVMLWRALKHVEIGFYIDVGANDPDQDSVTKAFYDRGWRGINIEPVSQWFEKLVRERLRDINLQIAAGAKAGELLIYELPDTGLSTFDRGIAERHEAERGYQKIERIVPVKTLTEICINLHTSPIHFLKIDVEGAEKQVLEGVDFSILRPWIVLVESTLPNSPIEDYETWEPILLTANYEYVYFDGLNRFYVAKEHLELRDSFMIPPNVFDGFALSGDATSPFCNQVLAEVKQNASEASSANTRVEHLAEELEKTTQALEKSEMTLTEQQAHTQWLQNEWDAAKAHAEHLTTQLDEKSAALAGIEAILAEQQAHAQWLQNEWDAAKAKIDELNHSSDHWWTVADGLNQELQGVYGSKSWRITWPMRMVMKFIKRLFSLFLQLIRWVLLLPKRTVKRLLRVAMRIVLARPGLKAKGLRFLASRSELKARLRSLAANNGMLAFPPVSATSAGAHVPVLTEHQRLNADLPQLTPHARRIYDDLKAAIANQQKGDN
ncbi:SAM-dependent methyltransferase [Desulfosporosinus sp. I2]|uniref:FkbM family methyltransferase n=1 Tax=Desulfosporosinus sp. I2 TaxID=1617025 RepID=UPI00061FAD8F|nr:FkbM family methyltransferase [Desulfosporosinus sp. I2]KJR46142.1 SAM-dependent methyltransferase [Desulfosporosinus sp. I2]